MLTDIEGSSEASEKKSTMYSMQSSSLLFISQLQQKKMKILSKVMRNQTRNVTLLLYLSEMILKNTQPTFPTALYCTLWQQKLSIPHDTLPIILRYHGWHWMLLYEYNWRIQVSGVLLLHRNKSQIHSSSTQVHFDKGNAASKEVSRMKIPWELLLFLWTDIFFQRQTCRFLSHFEIWTILACTTII